MKICRTCKIEKPLDCFTIREDNNNKLRNDCKNCVSERGKKYYQRNKSRIDLKHKEYDLLYDIDLRLYKFLCRISDPENERKKAKEYYQLNKEKERLRNKKCRQENPEKELERQKKWREKNK